MPFSRPTLSVLKSQVAQDIASQLPGADPLLRFSNLGILGRVLAGLINLCYGYLDWIARQAVPYTATDEFLEGWAALKGVSRKSATNAIGTASFSGTNGTVLPAGTKVTRGDGASFTTQADGTVSGGTVAVTIAADVPGAAGNTSVGVAMTLAQAVAGIQASGSVTTALTGGADVETDDALRSRMLQAYQEPPQGGAATDYVGWALAVAGVTRAWTLRNGMGPGTVVVYFMEDVAEAAHSGFPQGSNGVAAAEPRDIAATGDQLAVANAIYPLQPVTALVYASAPGSSATNFTISGIPTAARAAVTAAIDAVFLRDGSPGGVDVPTGQTAGKIPLSHFESAVAAVSGVDAFIITSPTTDITTATGILPTRGTVTFT